MTVKALTLGLGDLDRLRRAVTQARAVGGDLSWLGEKLAERLESLPAPRLAARDAAIFALASTFVGSRSGVARAVETDLHRYAESVWKRRDQYKTEPPAEYLTQPRKLAAFAAMQAGGEDALIGAKQISRILSTAYVGHGNSIPLSKKKRESLGHQTEDAQLNAMTRRNDQTFLDALRAAPVGREIVKAETARTVAERAKLLDAMRALDAAAPSTFAKLDKAVAAEIANVRAAEIALRAANEKLRAANYAKSGAILGYEADRQRLETALRNSPAADAIDAFARDMRDELDAARKMHEGGWIQDRHPVTREPMLRGYTNKESVAARVNAVHAAIESAEALRLAADQSDVETRIAALWASLPKIGPAKHVLVDVA